MKKRYFPILLSALMLLGTVGCTQNEGTDNTGTSDAAAQTTEGTVLQDADTLTLTSGGASDYVIVRGENANETEQLAATELQSYLKQISGVEIAIVTDAEAPAAKEIVVGKTNREADGEFDREELGTDGFVIKTSGEKLYLVGGETRGTLYSVYTFLEEYLGCRYYTSTVEKIPSMDEITFDKIEEDKQIPVIEYRDHEWSDYIGGSINYKQKINGWRGTNSYWRAEDAFSVVETINFNMPYVHTFDDFIPPATYFESHPEYYSMQSNGKRTTDQLCLSNPELLSVTIDAVRAYLDANPKVNIVSVSQNDNQSPCMCDNCMAIYEEEGGAYSGAVIRFVNAIAEALQESHPGVQVETLAYQYTRSIPTKTVPADNVIVRLCSIECCYSHPVSAGCDNSANASYTDGHYNTFIEDLAAWKTITDRIYIWEYGTNYAHYCMTFPNFSVLRENMKFYADNNVNGMYTSGNYECISGEFGELRMYVLAKLMWDPYMSEEEYQYHINDFLEGVYGEGWTYLREYIDYAQELVKDTHIGISSSPVEVYGNEQIDNSRALPEDLTLEKIKNYAEVDWLPYVTHYKSFDTSIITKGQEAFAAALAMAKTESETAYITRASLQTDYIAAYFYTDMYFPRRARNQVSVLLENFFAEKASDIPEDTRKAMIDNVLNTVVQQAEDLIVSANQTFCEKALSCGVVRYKEHHATLDTFTPNYRNYPENWDEERNWKN